MMISIVDDDPSVRRALKRLLRSFGYDVEAFPSAQEYLSRESGQAPDCLILDIHLGGVSGFDLQRTLQESGEAPPIIFITAYDDSDTRNQATAAVAYLRKPFDDQVLIDAIHKATSK